MMSRLLGIDFGLKRIGIAITDEKRQFAFPHDVIENDSGAIRKISALVKKEKIKKIILGLPLNPQGAPNPILKKAEKFKEKLEKAAKIRIEFESEIFTTKEARRLQGKHKKIDASAAALILKSYLERLSQS